METVTKNLKARKNIVQGASGAIASIGLEQTGKRVAGALVTPATWTINYVADRSMPNPIDAGIYAVGFLSAPASIVTGLWKAAMDDDINQKLELVRAKEPADQAPYILPCSVFGYAAPQINAMNIAKKGGTAWISSVGLWVYIKDTNNHLVADYTPAAFVQAYRPKKPYREDPKGGFQWEVLRAK